MFEDDDEDDLGMEESSDEYGLLTEAGFSEDQADAIVQAIKMCLSKDSAPEEDADEAPSGKKKGEDALAILIGAGPPKSKKKK